jgi:hypothetical protein
MGIEQCRLPLVRPSIGTNLIVVIQVRVANCNNVRMVGYTPQLIDIFVSVIRMKR